MEFQKLTQTTVAEPEVILGSCDYVERVGDFHVEYNNGLHIKEENQNNDLHPHEYGNSSVVKEQKTKLTRAEIQKRYRERLKLDGQRYAEHKQKQKERQLKQLKRNEMPLRKLKSERLKAKLRYHKNKDKSRKRKKYCNPSRRTESVCSENSWTNNLSSLDCDSDIYVKNEAAEDTRIVNEQENGNRNNQMSQMEYFIKKTIDDRFEKMENSFKEYVDSKVNVILKSQAEIMAMIDQTINKNAFATCGEVIFPIKTEEKLREVNTEMQLNYNLHITTLRTLLLPGGIKKNLQNIMDLNLLSEYNVDGKLGKKSFKQYGALINGIYRAVKCEGMTETAFIADLRSAFKLNKNKFFKFQSRKKSRKLGTNGEPRPKHNFAELNRLRKAKSNGETNIRSIENRLPTTNVEGES